MAADTDIDGRLASVVERLENIEHMLGALASLICDEMLDPANPLVATLRETLKEMRG